jgi:Alcohol acetyltransferase
LHDHTARGNASFGQRSVREVTASRYVTVDSRTEGIVSGRCERYHIARNHIRFYNNVGMTASYEVPDHVLREHELEELIFLALNKLINDHAVLGISIVNESSINPVWVRLPEIPLKEVVGFHILDDKSTETTRSIIEKAHQIPFERLDELPLWRLVVIEHTSTSSSDIQVMSNTKTSTKTIDIGFFWHHGMGDGSTGIAFHLGFLDALNTIESHIRPIETIVVPPKLDLLPSIEEAHPLPLSNFFVATQILKALLPKAVDKLLWTGPPIRSERNITHLRTLIFPAAIVDSLLCACRENNGTLTSLLLVVIARLLAINYPDYQHFRGKTAISFRRFTGTDQRAMVNYVTSIGHFFSAKPKTGYIDCGGKFEWSAVRTCKREIDAATAGPKNHSIGLLKFLNDYGGFLRNRVGQKMVDSFEVSNIGVMDGGLGDEGKSIKIKRTIFSQSSNVMGPPYIFSVATAKGGDLTIALTWQDGVVDLESMQLILVGLDTELRNLAKGTI